MKIKKKNTTIPISGKIVDTENVEDKTSNAPSLRLVEEMVKDTYSTEERIVGTWIDGKSIYRKVINIGVLPNKTTKTVNVGVSDIEQVIHLNGLAFNSTGGTIPIPYAHFSDVAQQVTVSYSNKAIYIATGTDRSSFSGYIIIEYTKNTD